MPLPQLNIEGAVKCPNCGSEKRATDEYVEELIKARYLPGNYDKDCLQLQITFMMSLQSPLNIQQVIPMLMINYAICDACHTLYVTRILSATGKVGLPPPGGGKLPPHFPQMKG